MKIKKNQLLKIFKNYRHAARFFKISPQAVSLWEYIPVIHIYNMERNGLIEKVNMHDKILVSNLGGKIWRFDND